MTEEEHPALGDLRLRLANAPEDDCGNDRLCGEAAMKLSELRLNLRLMRRRLDGAIDHTRQAEESRREAMDALEEARDLILGANHGPTRYPRAFTLLTGEVDRADD